MFGIDSDSVEQLLLYGVVDCSANCFFVLVPFGSWLVAINMIAALASNPCRVLFLIGSQCFHFSRLSNEYDLSRFGLILLRISVNSYCQQYTMTEVPT